MVFSPPFEGGVAEYNSRSKYYKVSAAGVVDWLIRPFSF